ncbi:hypothetical protein B0H11DRAFT_2217961 [Mycena galericulata]|nr:hypothetical protein B0H11DRAFT_2217961 [Mycena galericulata]
MEFCATSQLSQDGEDSLFGFETPSNASLFGHENFGSGPGMAAIAEIEIVGSSQPFADGEEDLHLPTNLNAGPFPMKKLDTSAAQSTAADLDLDSDADGDEIRERRAQRARLVRRAPPIVGPVLPTPTRPRTRPLVRRVTMAAEIQRRRERARLETRRILKKLRALARATTRLRRKHRQLCEFVADTPPAVVRTCRKIPALSRSVKNKENILQ